MGPRIFRTKVCSKCKSEIDRTALVKLRSDVELCARCLEVEFRAGQRIVRGHLPWYAALPIGIFLIGGPIVTFLEVPAGSRAQVGVIVGFIVVALARVVPLPGAWTLWDAPAGDRLDVDRAIELAKKANRGTTGDPEYAELKRLCAGPREIEALLVIAQFGEGLPAGVDVVAPTHGNESMVPEPTGQSTRPGSDSIELLQSATGPSEPNTEENEPQIAPCATCGGRGRIERQGSRSGLFGKLIGAEQIVEKCSDCNGTGAAQVSLQPGGLTRR